MRIEQLYYLIEISKSTSITTASKKLHISFQALSHSMKSLEEELGITLLARTNKGTTLTTEGQTLIKSAKRFLDDIEKLRTPKIESIAGNISFLTTSYCFDTFISELVCELFESSPNLKINCEVFDNRTQLIDRLMKNNDEFALIMLSKGTSSQESLDLEKQGFSIKPLFEGRCCYCCSKDHELAKHSSVSLKQGYKYKYVNLVEYDMIDPCFPANNIINVPNKILMDKMVSSGIGISYAISLPFPPYQTPQIDNTLVIKIIDDFPISFCLVYPPAFVPDHTTTIFLDILLKSLNLS